MPTVSAIIPTRNRALIVRRAVRSALAQTFTDLEVIVVIDGPDCATVESLQGIADPRLRFIELEESVGASGARNAGAEQARGKWIALLDDDDEWLPTKIAKQVRAAEALSFRLTFVVCSFILKTKTTEAIVPTRPPRKGEPISEYMFGAPRNGYQTSGFFCSRELMLRQPWSRLKGLQDLDWFLKATTDPEVQFAIVSDPLYLYWTDSENTITSKLDSHSCLAWGHANRFLMTRRAYSSFIAKICVPKSANQPGRLRIVLHLLREFLLDGSPTLSSSLMFVAYSFLPYSTRRGLANSVTSIKKQMHMLKPQLSQIN